MILTSQPTWAEYWSKLQTVPSRQSDGGALIVKPYLNSDREVTAHCKKIIGNYKVLAFRSWGGNGFGYSSIIFIHDTNLHETKIVNGGHRYTDVVRTMDHYFKTEVLQ